MAEFKRIVSKIGVEQQDARLERLAELYEEGYELVTTVFIPTNGPLGSLLDTLVKRL